MLKLASWNVNSLSVRLEQVLAWIASSGVDVLALQEIKMTDDKFPVQLFNLCGYHVAFSGQKTYNGVAIISREPMQDVLTDIPDFIDPQRRIIAATIGEWRLVNLYVPNGFEVDSDKYTYKLDWLNHVNAFIKQQLVSYPKLAVVGDFNIAPEDQDVHDPKGWHGSVLVSEPERTAFNQLLELGLFDSFRNFSQEVGSYSWWDYRAAAFQRNRGLRIDHILLSKGLNQFCEAAGIDKQPRRSERPSDHAPVWVNINSPKADNTEESNSISV